MEQQALADAGPKETPESFYRNYAPVMAEMSMNKAIHGAVRRDLTRFITALSRFAPGDVKRGNQIAAAWSNLDDQLTHHHTGEHEIAWPALTAVGTSPSLLASMDAEHDSMAAAIADVTAAVRAPAHGEHRRRVRGARGVRTAASGDHRAPRSRGAELEPVYLAKKDTPEIKSMGRAFGRVNPARGGRFLAWAPTAPPPRRRAAIKRDVPGPVFAIIGGIFGQGYRKNIAPIWKS